MSTRPYWHRRVADSASTLIKQPRTWFRRHWAGCAVLGFTAITVLGVLPTLALAKRDAPGSLIQTELALPPAVERANLDVAELGADEAMHLAFHGEADGWQVVSIESGHTLSGIFQDHGFGGNMLEQALKSESVKQLASRLRPGNQIALFSEQPGRLGAMLFDKGEDARVVVRLSEDGSVVDELLERRLEHRIERSSGVIATSLGGAADSAGLNYGMVLKIAKVLGYDIDFAQDLRVGDTFHVVYEQVYRDGERIRDGDVLAVSFINRGKRYVALRHIHPDGKIEYFDQEGRPLRKDFLRTPVDFTRISSRFSLARRHPILNRVRAHRGVDYAAPTGTPIYAAGDGLVKFRGSQRGFGNTVILDHGNKTTTLYAHMSRFNANVRQGGRVRQGDVIGYVGMTGLASGPHLHYEFQVNGQHRDPLNVTLPKPEPLKGPALERFQRDTIALAGQLDLLENLRATASTN